MNNMVNRYNISINYKLIPLQNDSLVRKKITESNTDGASTSTTGGNVPLISTPTFDSIQSNDACKFE
jgi:hypothetical protein